MKTILFAYWKIMLNQSLLSRAQPLVISLCKVYMHIIDKIICINLYSCLTLWCCSCFILCKRNRTLFSNTTCVKTKQKLTKMHRLPEPLLHAHDVWVGELSIVCLLISHLDIQYLLWFHAGDQTWDLLGAWQVFCHHVISSVLPDFFLSEIYEVLLLGFCLTKHLKLFNIYYLAFPILSQGK